MSSNSKFVSVAIVIIAVAVGARSTIAQPTKARSIAITVTEAGFEPEKVSVEKGEKVTLVFTRKTDKTCAKEVIVKVSDKETIKKDLPRDRTVSITTTFPKSGQLTYACAMNMITGVVNVQ